MNKPDMNLHAKKIIPEALKHVMAAKNEEWSRDFRSLCRGAGAHIRINGLVGFIAYSMVKGKEFKAAKHLVDGIRIGLTKLHNFPPDAQKDNHQFLSDLRRMSLEQYMPVVRHSLLVALWLKRLAETMIEETTPAQQPAEAQDDRQP